MQFAGPLFLVPLLSKEPSNAHQGWFAPPPPAAKTNVWAPRPCMHQSHGPCHCVSYQSTRTIRAACYLQLPSNGIHGIHMKPLPQTSAIQRGLHWVL